MKKRLWSPAFKAGQFLVMIRFWGRLRLHVAIQECRKRLAEIKQLGTRVPVKIGLSTQVVKWFMLRGRGVKWSRKWGNGHESRTGGE